MKYIVQKFGGTSIGTAERMLEVCGIVQNSLKKNSIVVVLFAMSSYVKTEGTTSKLLEAAELARRNGDYQRILKNLENNHLQAIEDGISGSDLCQNIKAQVVDEFQHLRAFFEATSILKELDKRPRDVIISTGEKLSAIIFTGILKSKGVEVEYVNLDRLIPPDWTEMKAESNLLLQEKLAERIKKCGHRVPVVTGFFGFVPNGIIETIGRGYTDFTAALIAAGLQAEELQIWKEVDGIFTADPRKVKTAKFLTSITPEEAAELTYYGSEVIHPFTMEQVIRARIPIRIKNTFKPNEDGSIIQSNGNEEVNHYPTAITIKKGVTVLNVNSNRRLLAHGFMAKMFTILDKFGVVVDLVSTSEVNVSLTIEKGARLEEAIQQLEDLGHVSILNNMAILSVVGTGMKATPGIASEIFTVLAEEKMNIEMITQGASEINVSCVIGDDEAGRALQVVHDRLILEKMKEAA